MLHVTCFKQRKNMAVEKNLNGAINFYKQTCLPVVTWNESDLSKQVVPITCTNFTVSTPLKVYESFLFRRSKKNLWYTLACMSLMFMRSEFTFLYLDSLISQSVNLSRKIAIQNAGCVFTCFYGGHRNSFRLQICSSFNKLKSEMKKWY